jgi:hypothetical protein
MDVDYTHSLRTFDLLLLRLQHLIEAVGLLNRYLDELETIARIDYL